MVYLLGFHVSVFGLFDFSATWFVGLLLLDNWLCTCLLDLMIMHWWVAAFRCVFV